MFINLLLYKENKMKNGKLMIKEISNLYIKVFHQCHHTKYNSAMLDCQSRFVCYELHLTLQIIFLFPGSYQEIRQCKSC